MKKLKFYYELNFIQKLIYRFRLRKLLRKGISVEDFINVTKSTDCLENFQSEDLSYNEIIKRSF